MGRVLSILLLAYALSHTILLSAATAEQAHAAAVEYIEAGEKQKAWNLLLPLAKRGDPEAAHIIGVMLMRSPEYTDYVKKAERFLSAAVKAGSTKSAPFLQQTKDINGAMEKNTALFTQIAIQSRLRSNQYNINRSRALARYQEKAKLAGIYTDTSLVSVSIYLNHLDAEAIAIHEGINRLINSKQFDVTKRYFLYVDQDALNNPFASPIEGFDLGDDGVTPDFNGQSAKQNSIHKYPAIVVSDGSTKTSVNSIDELGEQLEVIFSEKKGGNKP